MNNDSDVVPFTDPLDILDRKMFISTYMATYMAGMYVKRSDEHLHTGKHPYSYPKDVPVEDAHYMAEVAWYAIEQMLDETTITSAIDLARSDDKRT